MEYLVHCVCEALASLNSAQRGIQSTLSLKTMSFLLITIKVSEVVPNA